MKVNILHGQQGAKKAKGTVIVIDVIRASTTLITLVANGVQKVIISPTIEGAYLLKKRFPHAILVGERYGILPLGFDYDNSPSHILAHDLKNSTIIFTTTNGSHAILNAHKADKFLIGSFINASSIVKYLRRNKPKYVSLLAVGSKSPGRIEDEACARYLQDLLIGKKSNVEKIRSKILKSITADRLEKFKDNGDLDICLSLDRYTTIPKVKKSGEMMIVSF